MVNIDLIIEDNSHKISFDRFKDAIEKYVNQKIDSGDALLEIIITGNKKLHSLNKKYRGVDKTTDVLSFPILKDQKAINNLRPVILGSIVLNINQAGDNAELKNIDLLEECIFLGKHSVDHLLGKHHD